MKKRRVLLITRPGIGGAAKHVDMLVRFFDRKRFEIDVISSPLEDPRFCENLKRLGVNVFVIPMVRQIHPFKDIVALIKIFWIIIRGNYSVIHTHASKGGFLGRIASLLAGTPRIIYTPHGFYFNYGISRLKQLFYFLIEKSLASFTSALICLSSEELSHARRLTSCNRLAFIPNAIDIPEEINLSEEKIRLCRELNIEKDANIIGMVGRLTPPKDPLTFLEAAKLVIDRFKNVAFVVVGDGELLPQCKTRTLNLGIERYVHFLGYRQDSIKLTAGFDISVLASYWEGLPYVILESMSLGKPVIATDLSGCRDVVLHEKTGFLFRPGHAQELAHAILKLLSAPSLIKEMGDAGRSRIVTDFNPNKWIEEIQRLYS